MAGSKKIIITPETHWDREWYLPFQEYRAKLVLLMDSLLDICESNPEFKNFTLDGQTIPLEDYLEVRPEKEETLKKLVQNGTLSVGPMYILPDTYLVTGESMVRNLMLGHNIANRFGKVMKAGYIPDPFGHFAQMPQLLAGFDIPSILFMRGFGDEYEKQKLNMEFTWKAPNNAADIVGIHLVQGYGSLSELNSEKDPETGLYSNALGRIKRTIQELDKHTITDAIILNNGSDHRFAQPHIPEVVKQWNNKYGDSIGILEQADFEKYVDLVLSENKEFKTFEGELHGGRYHNLLSGVLSARMWIKQWNKLCENRLERYTEPLSALTLMFDTTGKFNYPNEYIWTAWRWLMKNHPHDSICGCSIDYVHDMDMRVRFGWAEQIADEIVKNNMLFLSKQIKFDMQEGERYPIFIYNPCPRKRSTLINLPMIINGEMVKVLAPENVIITDSEGNEVFSIPADHITEDRFKNIGDVGFSINFIAEDIPPMGIKTYYLVPGDDPELKEENLVDRVTDGEEEGKTYIENKFYKIFINETGTFDIFDKNTKTWYKDQGMLEDVGDWGDEYDFSGPNPDETDKVILSPDYLREIEITNFSIDASFNIYYDLMLPCGLTEDRKSRSENEVLVPVQVYVGLNSTEKKIFVDITIDNQAKDHRLRMLFPSGLNPESKTISADGHFMVVERNIELPPEAETAHWKQPPLPTHHQNHFVSVTDKKSSFSVMNYGLPEYEAINTDDKGVTFAITLVRAMGWLSRPDFKSRGRNAGPPLSTPGSQCLGLNTYTLGIYTGAGDWLQSKAHYAAEELVNPPEIINPVGINAEQRNMNMFSFKDTSITNLEQSKESIIGNSFSALELQGDAFILSSFKRADREQKSFIVRVVNLAENKQSGSCIFGKTVASAKLVNLYEDTLSDKLKPKCRIDSIKGNTVKFSADANVIVTLKIQFEK